MAVGAFFRTEWLPTAEHAWQPLERDSCDPGERAHPRDGAPDREARIERTCPRRERHAARFGAERAELSEEEELVREAGSVRAKGVVRPTGLAYDYSPPMPDRDGTPKVGLV